MLKAFVSPLGGLTASDNVIVGIREMTKGLAVAMLAVALGGCAVNRVAVQTTIQNIPVRLEVELWEPEAKQQESIGWRTCATKLGNSLTIGK